MAQLSRHLGERMGLNGDVLVQLEIAGLMHDVGKLCVPDEIDDKPAPLTFRGVLSVMERHSFETYQILRHIPGMKTIAEWAAFHHETLNGHGYPFRHKAERSSLEAASSRWRTYSGAGAGAPYRGPPARGRDPAPCAILSPTERWTRR
ncbi:MAG: HD domain-containing protein [Sulfuritalea sp.]|nr:HD domain-containing protein [Sulfuritalea sp.]